MHRKNFWIFLIVAVLVAASGCSSSDRPTKDDIYKVVRETPLQDIAMDRMDYAKPDKDGMTAVAAWGQAKDGAEAYNIFVIFNFRKQGDAWTGFIPAYGLMAEPVKDRDKEGFYKETSKDWEKLKGSKARG